MNVNEGEKKMSNTVDTGVAGILALLTDTARAGRGGFWNGGEGGAGGIAPWATPGTIRANVDSVSKDVSDLRNEFREGRLADQATTGFTALGKTITDGFQHACDKSEAVSVRLSDGQRDIEREMMSNFRFMDNKLCSIEKQQAVDTGELKANQRAIEAKIDANQKYNELLARNTALETQVACGCTTGCSTPCHNHHPHGGRG